MDINTFVKNSPELNITSNDIDAMLNTKKGEITRSILCFLNMNKTPYNNGYDQDHLHPRAGFDNPKIKRYKQIKNGKVEYKDLTPTTMKKWINLRDNLPNLDMLMDARNKQKTKTPLKDWVQKDYYINFDPTINENSINYDFEDFKVFYDKRAELIKKSLNKLFS